MDGVVNVNKGTLIFNDITVNNNLVANLPAVMGGYFSMNGTSGHIYKTGIAYLDLGIVWHTRDAGVLPSAGYRFGIGRAPYLNAHKLLTARR